MTTNGIASRKNALRLQITGLCRGLDIRQRQRLDREIFQRLTGIRQVQTARHVSSYVSMGHEVDTHAFIDWLLKQGKQVSIPKLVAGSIRPVEFPGWANLRPGRYGIPEPDGIDPVESVIDICITPGIGFSRNGARLGRGQGYYDRWFADTPVGLRLAPAYEVQLWNELPAEEHDVRVDLIVTEKQVIRP